MKAVYVPFPVPQKDEPSQNDITFKEGLFMEKRECSYKFKAKSEMAKPELHLKCGIYCGVLGLGS